MNSSTAAVIGALIGGGAAVVGQTITSVFTLRSARDNEKAALRREEHAKRRAVYEDFVVQVNAYRTACLSFRHAGPDDSDRWFALFELWPPVSTALSLIELHGPDPVEKAAKKVYENTQALDQAITDFRNGKDPGGAFDALYDRSDFEELRSAYSTASRKALDDLRA